MKNKSAEERSNIMKERALSRWSKTTKAQRSAIGRELARARELKKKMRVN